MAPRSLVLSFLLITVITSTGAGPLQSPADLAKLQNDFAMRYFEPEPQMALTKYYLDRGDRREAFFTLETARRSILEEPVFDHAFQVAFEGFDNSKDAEERLRAALQSDPHSADLQFRLADVYISHTDYSKAKPLLQQGLTEHGEDFRFTAGLAEILRIEGKRQEADRMLADYTKKYPQSAEAYEARASALHQTNLRKCRQELEEGVAKYPNDGNMLFRLAAVMQEMGELDKAESNFVKAASLAPKSENVQSWVGRFFFKVRNDGEKALPYYLNAYFLSPHAYETEYVESRLRNIFSAQAQSAFQAQLKAKKTPIELINDPNPLVVSLAIEKMATTWKPTYVEALVGLMGHEDVGVRWAATQLLKTKVDSSFDPTLSSLLKDQDLRKRGLAAYIAVYRWQKASFPIMKQLLVEESQLLRFDAISALVMEGGADGRNLVLEYAPRETNPTLKKIIEAAAKKEPGAEALEGFLKTK
jgi:tetratricopeptide (TPR) repeat protein